MASTRSPTRWALLIGIDFYFSGNKRVNNLGQTVTFPPLYGCVQDIEAVAEYLGDVEHCKIIKLTASHGAGDEPAEDKRKWPTHDNIVKELKHITENAQPGDLVYIHYSGHGIRRDRLGHSHVEGGDHISGTALVLTDVAIGGAYLTGYRLGRWVQNMVKTKELRVTVILDSCFSGRGMREAELDDGDIYNGMASRTAIHLHIDESILPSDEDADVYLARYLPPGDTTGDRDAVVQTSWLSDPEGCVVLSACEVEQTAKEVIFDTRSAKRGVFTYWICDILKRYPPRQPPSYDQIIEHVRSRIKKMWPRPLQDPVVRGDSDYQFFGAKMVHLQPASRVLSADHRSVTLSVGWAHGVAKGAVYKIYPEEWETEWGQGFVDDSSASPEELTGSTVLFVIDTVSEFRSVAIPLAPGTMIAKPGSRAVLKTWALESPALISLEDDIRGDLGLHFDLLKTLLCQTPGLSLRDDVRDEGKNSVAFRISKDESQENILILDNNYVRLQRVPRIPLNDKEEAVAELSRILSHLARYQAIRMLQSRNLSQGGLKRSSFEFTVTDGDTLPLPVSPQGVYEVRENEKLIVSVANRNILKPVYATLFCLTGSWGILRIYPKGRQPYEQLNGRNLLEYSLEMEVPQSGEDNLSDVYDIIRVCIYVGNDPPTWDELTLPSLRISAETFLRERDPTMADLVDTESDVDDSRDPKTRGNASKVGAKDGQWAFFDLVIHTKKKRTKMI